MLRRSLVEAARGNAHSGSLRMLADYAYRTIPESSERTAALASRLEQAYLATLTAGEGDTPMLAFDEENLSGEVTESAMETL